MAAIGRVIVFDHHEISRVGCISRQCGGMPEFGNGHGGGLRNSVWITGRVREVRSLTPQAKGHKGRE
jgi:hypothetical protein